MSEASNGAASGGGNRSTVLVIAVIAALSGVLFGYGTGVISGALIYIQDDFSLSGTMQGVVTSCVLVGAGIGALTGGRLTGRLGRRPALILTGAIFVVASLAMAFAPGAGWLVVSRTVLGLAIGFASVAGPMYASEVAPPGVRGTMSSLYQLAVAGGMLVAYGVNYAFADAGAWRWMLGLGAVPAVALAAGMFFMPESPAWLVARDLTDRARNVLRRTRASGEVEGDLREMEEDVRGSDEGGGLSQPLRVWVRRALVVGIGLAIFQQITGTNTVLYYGATIFATAGFGDSASILATIGLGAANVLATVVAVLAIDRLGRRPLLLVSLGGMAVCLAVLGWSFLGSGPSGAAAWASVISMVLFVGFFAIGMGPVFWVLVAEIYPSKVRDRYQSLATASNWAANFVVSLTFVFLIQALGQGVTFWVYGVVCVAAWLFTYFLVPETKGKSVDDLAEDYAREEKA